MLIITAISASLLYKHSQLVMSLQPYLLQSLQIAELDQIHYFTTYIPLLVLRKDCVHLPTGILLDHTSFTVVNSGDLSLFYDTKKCTETCKKDILQDCSSNYKPRLTSLNVVPLIYWFELQDMLFGQVQ